jgi:uncharacterized membrane protein
VIARRLSAAIAAIVLPLTACQPRGAGETGASAPVASATPALSEVRQGLVGNEETLHFTGTEPFWGGEVTGTSLTYSTPENQQGAVIEVTRSVAAGTLSLSGTLDGKPLALAMTNGRCSDGRVSDAALFALDPDLRTDSADEKVNLWRLWLGDDAGRFDLFDMHRQAAKAQIATAAGGDKPALLAVMTTLGGCQLPEGK